MYYLEFNRSIYCIIPCIMLLIGNNFGNTRKTGRWLRTGKQQVYIS